MSGLVGIGIDISGIERWRRLMARTPEVERTAFAPPERAWCHGVPSRLAAAWAAKEAVVKALGCGFEGVGWREVFLDLDRGTPRLTTPAHRSGLPDWVGNPEVRWFVSLRRLGTVVVALALAGKIDTSRRCGLVDGARLATEIVRVHEGGATRAATAAAGKVASHNALRRTAQRILPGRPAESMIVRNDPVGRPLASWSPGDRDDESVLVSLSRCSGWAGAVVGVPAKFSDLRDEPHV